MKGRIVDQEGQPIAYANIGIENKGIGTVSDPSGFFSLQIPKDLEPNQLIISHIGFEATKIPIERTLSKIVVLKQMDFMLNEVSVETKGLKSKELGNHSKAGLLISGFSYDDLGGEVGSKFNIKHDSYIEEVGFYINHNSFDTVKLRINVYTIANNLPDQKISLGEYVTLTNKKEGQVGHLLDHVIETKEDVIVTIELVDCYPKNKGNIYFSQQPPYFSKMYYRETSFDVVKKYIGGPMSVYLKSKSEK